MAEQTGTTVEQIVATVREVLAKYVEPPLKEKIAQEAKLQEDLGLDSLDSVEIMFELENAFGIEIPDRDLVSVKTVQDMVNYLKGRLFSTAETA